MPEDVQPVVRVTFDYSPDEIDRDDATGMSDHEFLRLVEGLTELGGTNFKVERVDGPNA